MAESIVKMEFRGCRLECEDRSCAESPYSLPLNGQECPEQARVDHVVLGIVTVECDCSGHEKEGGFAEDQIRTGREHVAGLIVYIGASCSTDIFCPEVPLLTEEISSSEYP